jgi:hypothetical protein
MLGIVRYFVNFFYISEPYCDRAVSPESRIIVEPELCDVEIGLK